MVDYNINREDLLPSEKAKAYKLKLDAMKRQGQQAIRHFCPNWAEVERTLLCKNFLAEQVNESRNANSTVCASE